MIKHSEQRVGIFVDVQNMYHSARNIFDNARVNFEEVLKTAVADRKLVRAIAYVVSSQSPEESSFFDALDKQGFELKVKDIQVFSSGAKKADWDVGMAIDAVKLADKVDVIVLVTGDGDFIPLVWYLRENKGCLVEVAAFRASASSMLVDVADDFTDLSDNAFLRKRKR
jgi:uncharacterized protein (TIGR00288 family)